MLTTSGIRDSRETKSRGLVNSYLSYLHPKLHVYLKNRVQRLKSKDT